MRINDIEFFAEELQQAALKSLDKADFAKNLGYTFTNGKVYKKIAAIVTEFNLDISHFDSTAKVKNNRKYPIVKRNCPVCDVEFETLLGSKEERVTCSYSCSNVFFSELRHTDESNLKRSEKLQKPLGEIKARSKRNGAYVLFDLICIICNIPFQAINKLQKHCSQSCAAISNWANEDYRENLHSQTMERVANGTHKGWISRSKIKPSGPESYTITVLDSLGIKYTREYKVGSWFIDFADVDRKIAVEIDGKQHELPERKAADAVKDKFLIDNGWKVYRIKWEKLSLEFHDKLVEKLKIYFK